MALPGFKTNRKFKRLVAMLGMIEAHVLGHVQMLWDSCYDKADDYIGDSLDVEIASGWIGDPGAFVKALLECGGNSGSGLIEQGDDGGYIVHDFWEHAPRYVRDRAKGNAERKLKGETISSIRSKAGTKGQLAKKQKASKSEQFASDGEANPPANEANERSREANCSQSSPVQSSPSQEIKETAPPGGHPSGGVKTKRKTQAEKLGAFSQEIQSLYMELISIWPSKRPGGEDYGHDLSLACSRIAKILSSDSSITREHLVFAAKAYFKQTRMNYNAIQYFFGPGKGPDGGPWESYVMFAKTVEQNKAAKESE